MKLWLVRHAQPLVGPGVCYGASDLLADGQSTLEAAQALANELPRGLSVMCSPLKRCTQLARAVLELRPDLMVLPDPRLKEMDFGHWEGHRWDAIPAAELRRWSDNFGTWRFGGVESVQDVMARVAAAWDETAAAGADTVWITHAGVMRAATLLAQGLRQVTTASQWPNEALVFGKAISLSI